MVTRAIARVGCGCELARRALTDPDEGARETWALDAPIAQERWQCSAVLDDDGERVYAGHPSLDAMDSDLQSVSEEVAAITGTDPCADCPMATTRSENNAWVHVVTRAYRDREKSALAIRHQTPSAVLMDALDCLECAVDARAVHDDEESQRRMKAQTHVPEQRGDADDD